LKVLAEAPHIGQNVFEIQSTRSPKKQKQPLAIHLAPSAEQAQNRRGCVLVRSSMFPELHQYPPRTISSPLVEEMVLLLRKELLGLPKVRTII
jgi:hypothetical protein